MFDVSFQEVLLILLIALVVIGPARLPKLARSIGLWVGRARAMFNSMRSEVERELELDELRKTQQSLRREFNLKKDLDDLKKDVGSVDSEIREVKREVDQLEAGLNAPVESAPATPPAAGVTSSPSSAAGDRSPAAGTDRPA